jgi:hypothetical protein
LTPQRVKRRFLVALLLAGATGEAAAESRRVVVLPFTGPRSGPATEAVRRALASRHRVISTAAFVRAARRAGHSIGQRAGRLAAARALGVQALIRGAIRRLGGRWALELSVFSAHNGRRTGSLMLPMTGTRVTGPMARRLTRSLERHLRTARAPTGAAPIRTTTPRRRRRPHPPPVEDTGPPIPPRSRLPSSPAVSPPPPTPAPSRGGFDDGSDLDSAPNTGAGLDDEPQPTVRPPAPQSNVDDEDLGFGTRSAPEEDDLDFQQVETRTVEPEEIELDDSDERSAGRPQWESIVEVSAGLMLVNRKFSFHDPVDPEQPLDYKTPTVVPAIHLQAAVYPGAPFTRSMLANFGLNVRFFRVLGLESRLEGSSRPATTTVQEIEAGLRYRWNILGRASSPTLTFGADFGRQIFHIDQGGKIVLPNIAYTYLKFAIIEAQMPLVRRAGFAFGVRASFDYLLVFSAGDIELTQSGSYGDAQTGGIDVAGGIHGSFRGFFARASGFYRRYFFSFDGTCHQQQKGCSYAGGALDIYLGVIIDLGYAY